MGWGAKPWGQNRQAELVSDITKTFCQLHIQWLSRLMRLETLYENISKGVCQKKKYFERELIWCWARGGDCMFHSVSYLLGTSFLQFPLLP